MTIQKIRFRMEGEAVVLQVQEPGKPRKQYGYEDNPPTWRDAKAEDLLEVAAFTRAYDALDQTIASLQSAVQSAQGQMADIMTREMRRMETTSPIDMAYLDKVRL